VNRVLDHLSQQGYGDDVARDRGLVLEIWEELFDHRSYTGRSGTFFRYEGLGCIYWHMVSKLRLAALENCWRACDESAPEQVRARLVEHYDEIRDGLGVTRNPAEYGAFPIDPYSHTPGNAGAQQPGMTGQVKEDILCRWGELGLEVARGCIRFRAELLCPSELLSEPDEFDYLDVSGTARTLRLPAGSLAFTYCQVPVVYHRAQESEIVVELRDGQVRQFSGLELDAATSADIFARRGTVVLIRVHLMPIGAARDTASSRR
jgi:hypothetical protein